MTSQINFGFIWKYEKYFLENNSLFRKYFYFLVFDRKLENNMFLFS